MSGNAIIGRNINSNAFAALMQKDKYLANKLKALEEDLETAKAKHTYKVLKEYPDPISFLQELKYYYEDRIFKLKKRTRKA